MSSLVSVFLSRWMWSAVGALGISSIIWYIGPLLSIGTFRPLDSMWVRVALIVLLVVLVIGHLVWKRIKAKRAEKELSEAIVAPEGTAAAPAKSAAKAAPAGSQEVALLRDRLQEAITLLRQSKQKKAGKLKAAFSGQYLYELPWYMFIGAPGSGKTTALVNSGLQFPLAERYGQTAISGVGGTRNCDWWFTDQAVLLDTAGRYTTQESDRDADAGAWKGFLKLLSRFRPRRPINGVILTISAADLLQQSPAEQEAHAQALRTRIQELHEHLNVSFPIYVLVSKADLLPGFMEFFGEFTREEREQVWGTTFAMPEKDQDVLADLDQRFAAIEQRLNERLIDRLQDERDPQKRAMLYMLPQHFSALKDALRGFLTSVFAPSRYEAQPLVRGVYLTSGTQEGSPIDRIMGSLARAMRLERKMLATQRPSGKSFFITRLFNDVVFAEAGIAGTNLRWERRRTALQWGAYAAAALLTVGLVTAWTVSYTRNKEYVREVDGRLKAVQEQVAALRVHQSSDVVELLPPLRSIRDIATATRTPSGSVPWSLGYGLYQGEKLNAAADLAYRRMLQEVLLPRIALRIEHQLRARGQQNLELLYEGLKAYIMLIGPEHFDDKALKAFVTAEWESSFSREVTLEQRKELESHLDRLLALGGVSLPVQPDTALIASARDTISRIPLAQRVYTRLKHQTSGVGLAEFTVAKAGGPSAPLVFVRASGQPLTRGVPGIYSYDGYHKVFTIASAQVATQLAAEEPWVLGQQGGGKLADLQAKERLIGEVRELYLQDYVRVWDAFLKDVRIVRPKDMQQSVAITRTLSAPDSPLPLYLRAVVKETTLGKEEPAAGEKPAAAGAPDASAISKQRDNLMRMFGQSEQAAAPVRARPESIVDDHFSGVRRMVRGQPAPIDATIALINELYTHLVATQAAVTAGSPPPPTDLPNKIRAESGRTPEPVQSMLTALSQSTTQQVLDKTRSNLNEGIATTIGEFCKKAVEGRYPFVRASALDVTRDDFARLFGPGGLLEDFFQKNLAAHVDTTARPWKFKQVGDASMGEASASLAQFQHAQAIRAAFFRGTAGPGVQLQFKPVSLDPTIGQLTIDVDGQVLTYGQGQQVPSTVQWPGPKGTSQVRIQVTAAGETAPGAGPVYEGPWALFRMLDRAQLKPTAQPEKMLATFNIDGRRAQFEIISTSVQNPVRLPELEQFRCPARL
jgi:type VI secretion system protein ImpL